MWCSTLRQSTHDSVLLSFSPQLEVEWSWANWKRFVRVPKGLTVTLDRNELVSCTVTHAILAATDSSKCVNSVYRDNRCNLRVDCYCFWTTDCSGERFIRSVLLEIMVLFKRQCESIVAWWVLNTRPSRKMRLLCQLFSLSSSFLHEITLSKVWPCDKFPP